MDQTLGPVSGLAIDWNRPWFAHWRELGEQVAGRVLARTPLHEALNEEQGSPVRFVDSAALPVGEPYERYIFDSGNCPTRQNLHDFFNGLCWLRLPRSKQRLNALQAGQIAAAGVGGARGPVRDAITVFDENGALLQAPPALWEALLAREWQRLFIELRPLWREARVMVFGHALLEKLAMPRKDITAHVWAECPAGGSTDEVDGWLAAQFTPARLADKPFTPLPLLGIPGWWPENQNFSFYDDSLVFRTARRKEPNTTAPHPPSRP
ncbi:MAG: DUF3025 domain-containing protein [Ramlibacter sp.]